MVFSFLWGLRKRMCNNCNYTNLLKTAGVDVTPNRLNVFKTVGNTNSPLSAQEIYNSLSKNGNINRATVYRILTLLVENGLVDRINTQDRWDRYGMAPNAHHLPHAHFYCTHCGNLQCLTPDSLNLDLNQLAKTVSGMIEKTHVRIDGICRNCLKP